jgi:predicted ATP-dependent protease
MAELRESLRLSVEDVTARCDPAWLPFESTDDLPALDAVFGQERAVRAIEFALGMETPGYNLFAAGPDGFGKSTIVESFLRRRAAQMPAPSDWVYVHNFEDPDRPVGIALPAGQGRAFASAVSEAVEAAIVELRTAFESDDYARRRQALATGIDQRRGELLEGLQAEAAEMGFALQITPAGILSAPLQDGNPLTEEQFQALDENVREQIQKRRADLEQNVQEALLAIRALEREAAGSARELDEEVARFAVEHHIASVRERFGNDQEIASFLEAVHSDIEERRDVLRAPEDAVQGPIPGLTPPAGPALRRPYEVNVMVTHDPSEGAPVIRETHPTFYNLLGRIEYQGRLGTVATDHTLIKPGSLAQANGGFIVVRLRDLLMQPASLDGLKRALSARELAVENIGDAFDLVPTIGLRPEPIPLDVKVVIVGEPHLYALLYRYDPDFRELFRVKADFETDFERSEENTLGLAHFVRAQCARAELGCFSMEAVARLVEFSSRSVEDQRRLSANLAALLDVINQADYWADADGAAMVDAEHVEKALDERIYRSSLISDRIKQAIEEGSIYVQTEGAEVGQINALSVYDLGDISFGRPSRITCVTSAGRGTIVMVERDSDMAGRIHNKGFLILRGFLANEFGQHRAAGLHASLTFEQLYGDIDGDSASSTELYALLSSLSQQPINQSIAVTGSVDQYGRIQPIGGATAKIEGFFDVCRQRGLDGTQGVMIPKANVENVILRPDVASAVEEGQFHIWAIETIEQGIELLTGVAATGERDAEGRHPEGTIFRMVEDRLDEFFREVREHPQHGLAEAPVMAPTTAPAPLPPGIPPQPPPEPPVIV